MIAVYMIMTILNLLKTTLATIDKQFLLMIRLVLLPWWCSICL